MEEKAKDFFELRMSVCMLSLCSVAAERYVTDTREAKVLATVGLSVS